MGLFVGFAHNAAHKDLNRLVERYRSGSPDQRTGAIFFAWLTRGIDLSQTKRKVDPRLQSLTGQPNGPIPVFEYRPFSEVGLLRYAQLLEEAGWGGEPGSHGTMVLNSLRGAHFYTALAVSYPNEGYSDLVAQLWDGLLQDYTPLEEVVDDLSRLIETRVIQEFLEGNDVSTEQLVTTPEMIRPHFLVANHPLTEQLRTDGLFP